MTTPIENRVGKVEKVLGQKVAEIKQNKDNFIAHLADYVSVKRYGAKGDGVTDDTTAIQNAVDNNNKVYFPPGTYITTKPIVLTSDKELCGAGELSKISNITSTGENRMVILCGYMAGNGGTSSPQQAISYPLTTLTVGSQTISLDVSDITNFSVGDVVLIKGSTLGGHNSKYQQIDEIRAISGTDITLKYGILLSELGTETTVSLVNLSNFSAAYSGVMPITQGYLAKNCYVHDLFLEQAVDSATSGQYVIFTACYQCKFENLKIYGSTPVGSNLSGFTQYKNCYANYHGGPSDNCEFQYMNVFDGLRYYRVGALVNKDVGFTINNGAFNVIRNCILNFGGTASSVSVTEALYSIIQDCTIIHGNRVGSGSITGCYYGKTVVRNCNIFCEPNGLAMAIYGVGNHIHGNTIYNAHKTVISVVAYDGYTPIQSDNYIDCNIVHFYNPTDAENGALIVKNGYGAEKRGIYGTIIGSSYVASDAYQSVYSSTKVYYPFNCLKKIITGLTLPVAQCDFKLRINNADLITFSITPTAVTDMEIEVHFLASNANMRVFLKTSTGYGKYANVSIGGLTDRFFSFDLQCKAGAANTITRTYNFIDA